MRIERPDMRVPGRDESVEQRPSVRAKFDFGRSSIVSAEESEYDLGLHMLRKRSEDAQDIAQSNSCSCNNTCAGCVGTDHGCGGQSDGCATSYRCGHTDNC